MLENLGKKRTKEYYSCLVLQTLECKWQHQKERSEETKEYYSHLGIIAQTAMLDEHHKKRFRFRGSVGNAKVICDVLHLISWQAHSDMLGFFLQFLLSGIQDSRQTLEKRSQNPS